MGLLDALNSDEGQLGLGLLMAAGPSMQPMGLGQRLAQGVGYVDQMKEADLKRKYLNSQIAENDSQAKVREAQIAKQAAILAQTQGLLGDFTAPARGAPNAAPSGGITPAQTAGLRGIPLERVAALKAAGGPDLIEAWKLANVPTNISAGGYSHLPGMPLQFNPDPSKGVTVQNGAVSAMPGAAESLAGIAGATAKAQEAAKAGFDTVTVTPAGQPPQLTTRAKLAAQVGGTRIAPAEQAAMDKDRVSILNTELQKATKDYQNAVLRGDQSAAARAQGDMAALAREIGGKTATVGMPLQSKEDELRSTKGVEGDAAESMARTKDIKTAQKFLSVANQAEKVLKSGPTSSGFGAMQDAVGGFFGKSPAGAVEAQQLKALGGWLVANVPRMEGPQSNFDVGNYQTMAADVANERLPIDRRLAALTAIKAMMQATVDGGGVVKPEGSWEPSGKKSAVSPGGWSATLKK